MFLAVAAAVIGGTALSGGSGTIIGAFLGAIVLGVLRDGLTIEGISANTFNMILGRAIIASMILNVCWRTRPVSRSQSAAIMTLRDRTVKRSGPRGSAKKFGPVTAFATCRCTSRKARCSA